MGTAAEVLGVGLVPDTALAGEQIPFTGIVRSIFGEEEEAECVVGVDTVDPLTGDSIPSVWTVWAAMFCADWEVVLVLLIVCDEPIAAVDLLGFG